MPEAMIALLDTRDYEEAVRLAISLGGDSDTQAAIAGGIAEAFYGGVPEENVLETRMRLPEEMRDVLDAFEERFRG